MLYSNFVEISDPHFYFYFLEKRRIIKKERKVVVKKTTQSHAKQTSKNKEGAESRLSPKTQTLANPLSYRPN